MLLRKRLGVLWSKVDAGTRENLKAALLQALMTEQQRSVRKAISR
jgi:hypothetical protein